MLIYLPLPAILVYKETEHRLLAEQITLELREGRDETDCSTEQELVMHFSEAYYHRLVEAQPPARPRGIFKLSRFQKMSNKEIAARLSIPEKTVETQLYRATSYLKKYLLTEEGAGMIILFLLNQW